MRLRTGLSGGAVLTLAAVQHLLQRPVARLLLCPTLLLRDRGSWRGWAPEHHHQQGSHLQPPPHQPPPAACLHAHLFILPRPLQCCKE